MTQIIIPPGAGGGGGLPEGWTTDGGNPATVFTNGGYVVCGGDGDFLFSQIGPGSLSVNRASDGQNIFGVDQSVDDKTRVAGLQSGGADTALGVDSSQGATVGLDLNSLPILRLPTADPHVDGALWNDSGTPAISAG